MATLEGKKVGREQESIAPGHACHEAEDHALLWGFSQPKAVPDTAAMPANRVFPHACKHPCFSY